MLSLQHCFAVAAALQSNPVVFQLGKHCFYKCTALKGTLFSVGTDIFMMADIIHKEDDEYITRLKDLLLNPLFTKLDCWNNGWDAYDASENIRIDLDKKRVGQSFDIPSFLSINVRTIFP